MIKLTPTSTELLGSWIALSGTFRLFFEGPTGIRTPAELTIEQQLGAQVRLILRVGDSVNSCVLQAEPGRQALRRAAQRWLEDCANGQLEAAA